MRFPILAAIDTGSVVVGVGSAIALAVGGAGYWALVAQPISAAALKSALLWTVSGWRPAATFRGSGINSMLAFGRHLTAFRLIQFAGRAVDKILIGRYAGAVELGYYANAQALVVQPVSRFRLPLSHVAHAALSRVQSEDDRYRSLYRGGVLVTTSITLPILGFLALDGDRVISTLLGPQWDGAVPLFRILIIGGFARAFAASLRWVYLSLGATRRQLQWGTIESVATTSAYVIGVFWGATGVAAAYSASAWALLLPGVLFCFKESPLRVNDLLRATWRPGIACAIAAVGLTALDVFAGLGGDGALRLSIDLATFGALYAATWLAMPGGVRIAARALRSLR
jgi:O-antigen/teichoic acid export membrane protein